MTGETRQMLRLAIDQRRRELAAGSIEREGFAEFVGRHGTEHGYRMGCRCESCRNASRVRRRARYLADPDRKRKEREYRRRRKLAAS